MAITNIILLYLPSYSLKLFRSTRGYKADNYHDLSVYNDMTFDLHKKDIDKNDKNR